MSLSSRKTWSLHGGIHPPENKKQSLGKAIQQATIAPELILPLSQHIGAPAKAIVEVGDKVLTGQKIAEAQGFVSVPVHASSSGTVVAIENRAIAHASGMTAPCIVIQTDGEDNWVDCQGTADYQSLEKSTLIELIREAGIAGMGGAGFPSAIKLNTRDDQPIETLIINGTECEPYITADDILMQERANEIIEGIKILQYIVKPSKDVLVGVEDNKPEAIAALQKAAAGTDIEIVSFPTKYPSGGEKQLIQILTGKEVPSGGLPAAVGIVCQNIGSTAAIYQAIVHGRPLVSRITTVTGDAVSQPQNFEVRLGTPIKELLKAAGFREEDAARLVMGGPMMGFALQSPELPIVKTTNCILAPTEEELPTPPPAQACIRCGMCSEACPVSLLPQQMYWYARSKNHEELKKQNLFDCIECGACSYVCPSNIPLVQYYRASKSDIRQAELDQKKAEYSKDRFEARQARLEKIEAEKEAKRKARQEKAAAAAKAKDSNDSSKTADPVQAAIDKAKAKPESTDPVQAAIERAKAKREGGAADENPKQKLEENVEKLTKRLATSEQKLIQAQEQGSDQVDAFIGSVEKLQEKLNKAKQELADFSENNKAVQPAVSDDPVQAAIERAKAKRAGNDQTQNPQQKLEQDIEKLEKRLATSEQKLNDAKEQNLDTVDAFASAVEKLQEKLSKAKAELAKLTPAASDKTAVVSDDPVQAAIDRAKAKRAGNEQTQSPQQKLEQDIEKLEKRLAASEQKLNDAKEQNLDTVDAFAAAVEKLQEKLNKAKGDLSALAPKAEPISEPEAVATVSDDPVQAAIDRAKAKRAAQESIDPKQKLEQDIAKLQKRLAASEQKLADAQEQNLDTVDAFAASVEKLQEKLQHAEQALQELG